MESEGKPLRPLSRPPSVSIVPRRVCRLRGDRGHRPHGGAPAVFGPRRGRDRAGVRLSVRVVSLRDGIRESTLRRTLGDAVLRSIPRKGPAAVVTVGYAGEAGRRGSRTDPPPGERMAHKIHYVN